MAAPSDRTVARRGIVAAALAAACNAALVPVARALDVAPGFEPLSYPPVVFLTVLGAVAATFVFTLVRRVSSAPVRTFTRIAAVVLVLSVLPDLVLLQAQPAATVPGVLVLMAMHVVAAVVMVGVLTRGFGSDSPPRSEQPQSGDH